jgi:hypothetical protein
MHLRDISFAEYIHLFVWIVVYIPRWLVLLQFLFRFIWSFLYFISCSFFLLLFPVGSNSIVFNLSKFCFGLYFVVLYYFILFVLALIPLSSFLLIFIFYFSLFYLNSFLYLFFVMIRSLYWPFSFKLFISFVSYSS